MENYQERSDSSDFRIYSEELYVISFCKRQIRKKLVIEEINVSGGKKVTKVEAKNRRGESKDYSKLNNSTAFVTFQATS